MSFVKLPVLRHGPLLRQEELLPDTVFCERTEAVRSLMRSSGAQSLLIWSDAAYNAPVCYLTQYPCYGYNKKALAVIGLHGEALVYSSEPIRNIPIVRGFTYSEMVRERKFIAAAAEKAAQLAGDGIIGTIAMGRLSGPQFRIVDSVLSGCEVRDLTAQYNELTARKDHAALNVMEQSCHMAKKVLDELASKVQPGANVWDIAADADYMLHVRGCESANIMSACGEGEICFSYPESKIIAGKDSVLFYVAAQFARYWGSAGRSVYFGPYGDGKLELLREIMTELTSLSVSTMSIAWLEEKLHEMAQAKGIKLSRKISPVCGIGLDLEEYPIKDSDHIPDGCTLQITLQTQDIPVAMLSDILWVQHRKNSWLCNVI